MAAVVFPPSERVARKLSTIMSTLHQKLPACVDGIVTAAGLTSAIFIVKVLDAAQPGRWFTPPMLSSSILFFAGPEPPPTTGFAIAAAGAAVVGLLGQSLHLRSTTLAALSVGSHLMWCRVAGVFYAPAAVLAAQMGSAPVGTPWYKPFQTVGMPWVSGHAIIYAAAVVTSKVRGNVRVRMARDRLAAHSGSDEVSLAALHEVFDKYDIDHSGFLDPLELKLAIRLATGVNLPLNDCVRLVRSIDADGNNKVDFFEFEILVRGRRGGLDEIATY